jgi:small subunit ribosomal protein S7
MRRNRAVKRARLPDPKYKKPLLTRFVNVLMRDGKRSVAEKIVYGAIESAYEEIKKQQGKQAKDSKKSRDEDNSAELKTDLPVNPAELLELVLYKVKPMLEVRSKRVGGATYQIPQEVSQDRGIALAIRWIKQAAASRNNHGMVRALSQEMVDAYFGRGVAMKKRTDVHQMANANKAFAHFR